MHEVFQKGGAYAKKFLETTLVLADTSQFHLMVFVSPNRVLLQELKASLVMEQSQQYTVVEHRFTDPQFPSVGRFAASLPKAVSPYLIVAQGLESVPETLRSEYLTLLNNHREDFKYSQVSLALFVVEENYSELRRLAGDFLAWAKVTLFTDPDVRVKPSVAAQRTVTELTDYVRRIREVETQLEQDKLLPARRLQLFRDLAFYRKQLGHETESDKATLEALALAKQTENKVAAEQIYLDAVIDEFRYLDVRGLAQSITSVTLELDQVFVALQAERGREWTLPYDRMLPATEGDTPDPQLIAAQLSAQVPEVLDLAQAVCENNALIILGDPGSGKTTLLRFLAYQFAFARRNRYTTVTDSQESDYGVPLVPVYARISRFAEALKAEPNLTLRHFLITSAGRESEHDKTYQSIIERALKDGEALLLLDGLDEITEPSQRSVIVEKIEAFTRTLKPTSKIVLSSRIVGYSAASLGHPFHQSTFTLCPMDTERIQKFAESWCLAVERSRIPLSDNQIIVSAAQKQSSALLQAVEQSPGVRELAGNPLLLTLLALIQRDRIRLPERRVELYEAATETLLRTWNYARGFRERDLLSEQEVQTILGPLALYMHEHCPSGLIEEAEARHQLALAVSNERGTDPQSLETQNAVDEFLRRIRDTSGLFTERAPKLYGFLHLTFEEYYTAMELISDTFEAAAKIAKYRFKPRWEEPIRLAIASLRPKDASRIIKEALWNPDGELKYPDPWEDILERGFFLAIKCLSDSNSIDKKLLKLASEHLLNRVKQNSKIEYSPIISTYLNHLLYINPVENNIIQTCADYLGFKIPITNSNKSQFPIYLSAVLQTILFSDKNKEFSNNKPFNSDDTKEYMSKFIQIRKILQENSILYLGNEMHIMSEEIINNIVSNKNIAIQEREKGAYMISLLFFISHNKYKEYTSMYFSDNSAFKVAGWIGLYYISLSGLLPDKVPDVEPLT